MPNSTAFETAKRTLSIAVFGASGDVGRRVIAEGVQRRHQMTGIARRSPKASLNDQAARRVVIDVENATDLESIVAGHDVVISALRPRDGQENRLVDLTARVVNAATATQTRFIIVGGAAPLQLPKNSAYTVLTAPNFLPESVGAIAQACQEQHDWVVPRLEPFGTYVCPPAMLTPGLREGTYRVGGNMLLVDDQGNSQISMEDFAVALIDESEQANHTGNQFTVAY